MTQVGWLVALWLGATGVASLVTGWRLYLSAQRREQRLRTALEPQLRKAWEAAAEQARLTSVEASPWMASPAWLTARSGALFVRLEKVALFGPVGTRFEVRGLGFDAAQLSIQQRALGSVSGLSLEGNEVQLGDPSFDREIQVLGQEALALAVLDRDTRHELSELLRGVPWEDNGRWMDWGGSFSGELLAARLPHPEPASEETLFRQVSRVLDALLRLAQCLARPADVAERLGSRLREEPEAGVRRQALRVLLRDFPQHPATRKLLPALCSDPDERVRLAAALALGREGRKTLLALVEASSTSEGSATRAVRGLGEALPFELAVSTLRRALVVGQLDLAEACLDQLATGGRSEAEQPFLDTLRHHQPAVVRAAVRGLGKVGAVTAVPALRDVAARWPGELAADTRQAIAEIQARLEGAEAGQLTLAASDVGQLSLAGGEAGTLALTQEVAPGRLGSLESEDNVAHPPAVAEAKRR